MRWRLFLAFAGLVVAVLIVLAVVEERVLRARFTAQIQHALEGAARATAMMLPPSGDPDALADSLAAVFGARVTLIDREGRVAGDSEFDSPSLEALPGHDDRPEVRDARTAGLGSAQRYSTSVAGVMTYVAVAARDGWVARVALSLGAVDAAVAGFRRDLLGVAALAVLVSLVLAALLAFALDRPVRRASEAARVMSRGDLRRRLPEGEGGEIGELNRALNRLAEDLRHRLQELEEEKTESETLLREMGEGVLAVSVSGTVVRANATLERALGRPGGLEGHPISDLFRDAELVRFLQPANIPEGGAEAEFHVDARTWLVSARRLPTGGVVAVFADLTPLRRLETVRSEFVANASHELKTPLTAVRGFAETLTDPAVPEEERRNFARRIVEHAKRMTSIVEDLLTLARLESPGRTKRREVVAVAPLAQESWRQVSSRADVKRSAFSLDIEPEDLAAWGDPEGVRQILENLLDNAIRHSDSREVGVRARLRPSGEIQLTVWDSGEGIPSIHLERIFERFYRVDPSRSRATGGTGLGLSIVKHWAEAMGGRAWAESAPRSGTRVHVTLPHAAAGARVPAE